MKKYLLEEICYHLYMHETDVWVFLPEYTVDAIHFYMDNL